MSNPYDLYSKNELPLYDTVNKNNDLNYDTYQCFNNSVVTEQPWFPEKNICPCDPSTNNITGRGYTLCNFGIVEQNGKKPLNNLPSNAEQIIPKPGTLYNQKQVIPPQYDPNPFVRIGQSWRTI